MSIISSIQWTDSTVNPFMGCGGCELYPKPGVILNGIDKAMMLAGYKWKRGDARQIVVDLISGFYREIITPSEHHDPGITTTNLWHVRKLVIDRIRRTHGKKTATIAQRVIEQALTCYAAKLHLNRGYSIVNPGRKVNPGYAPVFEQLTAYPGRMMKMAKASCLRGAKRPGSPWKDKLPRVIFVSDMGDAFTRADNETFDYLERDAITAIRSEAGRNHIWPWLTKRPHNMAKFSERIGGFPDNVIAMATVTGADAGVLSRIDKLREVKASMRGLSIEPLWERIPPEILDLTGIDWVIVGGESGSANARPFAIEWALELGEHCHNHGVAFFLKQLGRNPTFGGMPLRLKDAHGGDWSEWPACAPRVREFPRQFISTKECGE